MNLEIKFIITNAFRKHEKKSVVFLKFAIGLTPLVKMRFLKQEINKDKKLKNKY